MEQQANRAEFLAWLMRGGLLAGLLGIAAAALHGKKPVSACFNENYCASCRVYSGCALPEKKEVAP